MEPQQHDRVPLRDGEMEIEVRASLSMEVWTTFLLEAMVDSLKSKTDLLPIMQHHTLEKLFSEDLP